MVGVSPGVLPSVVGLVAWKGRVRMWDRDRQYVGDTGRGVAAPASEQLDGQGPVARADQVSVNGSGQPLGEDHGAAAEAGCAASAGGGEAGLSDREPLR